MVRPNHPKWEGAALAFAVIVLTGYAMVFVWGWTQWYLTYQQ